MPLKMIAVVNQSKRANIAEVAIMVAACNTQVADHFAPAWGLLPCLVKQYGALVDVPITPEVATFVIVDANTAEPDALGWHTEEGDGQVTGVICVNPVLDNGGVVLFDTEDVNTVSVSSVLSHEVLETVADQFVNYWADGPNHTYAYEVCDPVEATSYRVDVEGVGSAAVSDFVLPSWFDLRGDGPWNFCHAVAPVGGAFELARGGYCVLRDGGPGTEKQIFAHREQARPWRKSVPSAKAGFRSSKRVAL